MELLANGLALIVFLKDSNKNISRSFLNKQGGIKSLYSNETAKRIWEFYIHKNTHISALHIPGKHNILADHDSAEWILEPKIFDYSIHQFVGQKLILLYPG